MLNKRVNILFNERIWKRLSAQAKRVGRSASDLVREAVEQQYIDEKQIGRKAAFKKIVESRPRAAQTTIDYKSLVEKGRRL